MQDKKDNWSSKVFEEERVIGEGLTVHPAQQGKSESALMLINMAGGEGYWRTASNFQGDRKKSSVFQGWEKRHWKLGKKILSSQLGQMERHIMLLDLHINLFQFHSGHRFIFSWIQFSSVAQLCLTLQHMDYSTWGFPIRHQLLELAQTHIHRVSDAIQPSHPFLSPSSTAFNLYQHQGLFHWVSSSHQVAKVLEFQL